MFLQHPAQTSPECNLSSAHSGFCVSAHGRREKDALAIATMPSSLHCTQHNRPQQAGRKGRVSDGLSTPVVGAPYALLIVWSRLHCQGCAVGC